MLLILSAVLTSLFLLSKNSLLMWFGASETTFSYANTYVTIYTAGTFFALISGGMNSFLIAQGFSGLGMANGSDRSSPEYPSGSAFYLRFPYGRCRCSHCNSHLSDCLLSVCPWLSVQQTDACASWMGRFSPACHETDCHFRFLSRSSFSPVTAFCSSF